MKRILSVQLIAAAAMLSACQDGPLEGPPKIRLGRDLCAECGMIISEDACSSSLLIEREGTREHALFDDIGCMLDYERSQAASLHTLDTFVRDHDSHGWIPASSSWFLVVDGNQIRTPMASGMVAFGTKDAALAAQTRFGGRVVPLAELAAARRAASRVGENAGSNR